jgi:hypothetical protein
VKWTGSSGLKDEKLVTEGKEPLGRLFKRVLKKIGMRILNRFFRLWRRFSGCLVNTMPNLESRSCKVVFFNQGYTKTS